MYLFIHLLIDNVYAAIYIYMHVPYSVIQYLFACSLLLVGSLSCCDLEPEGLESPMV